MYFFKLGQCELGVVFSENNYLKSNTLQAVKWMSQGHISVIGEDLQYFGQIWISGQLVDTNQNTCTVYILTSKVSQTEVKLNL